MCNLIWTTERFEEVVYDREDIHCIKKIMGCKDEKAYIYIYKYIYVCITYIRICMYVYLDRGEKRKAGWDR